MARVIASALLIVALAVLVTFNLGFTTSFSLFGARFETVPTMAVALLSFAAGVVYSLFLYLARSLHARRVRQVETRGKDLTRREKELADRSAAQEKAGAEPQAAAPETAGQAADAPPARAPRKSLRDRLRSLW